MRKLLLLAPLALVACATPEARVRTALLDAGLSPRVSACMARRMVDRLSLMQLRRLGGLKNTGRARSVGEFLHATRALEDPEIVAVTTRAALGCAVGL